MKLELNNHFHNTTINSVIRKKNIHPHGWYEISATTYSRLYRELCGYSDCECGGTYRDKYKLVKEEQNRGGYKYYIHEKDHYKTEFIKKEEERKKTMTKAQLYSYELNHCYSEYPDPTIISKELYDIAEYVEQDDKEETTTFWFDDESAIIWEFGDEFRVI